MADTRLPPNWYRYMHFRIVRFVVNELEVTSFAASMTSKYITHIWHQSVKSY